MEINRSVIKYNAKIAMTAAKPHNVFLVAAAYWGLYMLLTLLSGAIMRPFFDAFQEFAENMVAIPSAEMPSIAPIPMLLYTAISLITFILSIGFSLFALRVSRYQPSTIGTLFDGFGLFFKAIGLSIVEGFFIFLWSLLFYIPGILAALRYSQAYFIMLDHPEYSIMRCIRESKRLMDGRKGEFFVLELSFIGWMLLSVVPFISIWVLPYVRVTMANYYNALVELDWKSQQYQDPQTPPAGPGFGF